MRRDPSLALPPAATDIRTHTPRVLQIPGEHPYVQQIAPPEFRFGGSPCQVPSPALSPHWPARHRGEFDVVHLHFGYEHLTDDDLRDWIGALEVPLVLTVHDLRNPHQVSRDAHDRHLALLVPAAAAVLTLTAGAAAEIQRRWGRTAHVVPHPAIFDLDLPPAPHQDGKVVGIHLKDLRRNIVDHDRVIAAAAAGARAAGGRLRVDVHPGAVNRVPRGDFELRVHERFTDLELAGYLRELDAYVLPNRFGTHSGWLEACRDMGTRVVAPSCGYYADQWDDVLTYQHDEQSGLDPASLESAVQQALTSAPVAPADRRFRARQLELVQSRHIEIYQDVHRAAWVSSKVELAVG